MTGKPSIAALIVAAGQGVRSGGGVPKQYRRIGGKAVLAHAVDALARHPAIGSVQVVIGAGQEDLHAEAVGGRTLPPPVTGGATRRDSVIAGLAAVDADIVLIHDAARPFLPAAVIDRLIAALDGSDGAVPALAVADTLAKGDALLGDAVPRDGLHRVQTPQAFRRADILAAHRAWDPAREATDDAQVARAHGLSVAIVEGDRSLEKLTFAADFEAAEERMAMISRTAMGFDVHGFTAGDGVQLGGVRIAHDRALAGHSDADVALHALTDALLGTIAAGDIGSHFPPSDQRWKGADSAMFLAHARDLVAAAGGIVDFVDLTIICEAPKVGPHRAAIRDRIAALLGLTAGQVSVKATTTERLGFTGRREGIAAQAVATVRVPSI
ncbi:2-C-methyl-D-erythritol 4-phosphate cytidylyltransferase 2-C-methyl-D-erythritol 2,4-cyclodiphosphate synthase [Rhizorhabdus wittichii RW1]|uniref:Bifunctional enzyme IspD/IspF n=1 Tax=Rhizorhabdus wittichii (strain DSM 6014 / CCUG 31198 / JCM 15750 / NBRC 105917 / EY 4224 / RW1) TaxID=392499 RepID=ISPDF_RHIWR|nr:RecName: Full=Bifunctional enzyme IspD/IspF; Includes: RecName: Full=2-C-methyl-D-erythritol 4-phosphate cytidylyltransferase; AltName: Full=4-diphosphocytidyl-2C-methyl-D-erythritol synthase; AltName: Full=MEP cytidylyltransferase; Short=MCT; Includes: RecName: Full=2-C-methyl-D-erythritol 2,4-cyclodiphosphate synthase; Short=MECDP-synthase; Short=MECPP-synthase; Short=MECPS [Rhizorhabdus wittichii RW1]ABQ66615.1 2-C-methyl-D-erythritol 4-phosphate cytidylyltransferase 2-C-methyl-D-erythritol 